MSIKPAPVDAMGRRLLDSGTDLTATRINLTDAWKAIQFVNDIKALSIRIKSVSAGEVAFRGTLPGNKEWLKAVAVIDNGTTVTLHTGTNHNFTVGDDVEIHGTTYYDGTWELEAGSTGDHLIITPDSHNVDLEGIAVVDATGGKVSIAALLHGFNDGDSITIIGSDNYDATYTLDNASTTNSLVITAAYAAETFAAGVIASGFPTETTATTDYAVGYQDVLLAATESTDEIRIVADADVTVCSLKCATGSATAVVDLMVRR
jgi:hypothetical protein